MKRIEHAILWAKWHSGKDGYIAYHPLICHLVDVAMVFEVLWENVLPVAWKTQIAETMSLPVPSAGKWLMFFAGLHDIGKACPGFQTQLRDPVSHALVNERLNAAGLRHANAAWLPHGCVSAKTMRVLLRERYGISRANASQIATAIGGHHGTFFTEDKERRLPVHDSGDADWEQVRREMAEDLAAILDIPIDQPPKRFTTATAMALAGAVSVADWIGSIAETFVPEALDAHHVPMIDLPAYRDRSRGKAQEIVTKLGWLSWTPPDAPAAFSALFPEIAHMRRLQEISVELTTRIHGPGIVIIEAPMGEGKTEAAILLADHWNTMPGMGGMYLALPTQATSNSMYMRVWDYIAHRFPSIAVPLHLLHGRAMLSPNFQEAISNRHEWVPTAIDQHETTDEDQTAIGGNVIAAEWFLSNKRSLLAPFGVGTVDQILLAALQIRHGFVRMFGLSTKVVIIDEVHAYDAYMTTLLKRLLLWLGALGAPVVLLSATLPCVRRQELIASYGKGSGWSERPLEKTPYPRITFATRDETAVIGFLADPARRRSIRIHWLKDDVTTVIESVRNVMRDGGCVAIICSTVKRSQKVYSAVREWFPGEADDGEPLVDLFHARYPFEERAERERRAISRFGKKGPRPRTAILVATQVIEQSLDLDFDLMFSDIAPVDLLLQRAGRLHRHDRKPGDRPVLMIHPQLFIIGKPQEGLVPRFDRGIEYVYPPHLLLRTWFLLRARTDMPVAIPDEIESMVEWVYGPTACPDDVTSEERGYWDKTLQTLESEIVIEEVQAENRFIKDPANESDLAKIVREAREEDAPELHASLQAMTRLSSLSIEAICLYGSETAARLHPDDPPINLRKVPPQSLVDALLGRSVKLTHYGLVNSLITEKPPTVWRKIGPLCRARPLFFDEEGIWTHGDLTVRLDPVLGLVIAQPTKNA